jgi:hypothetical protein
MRAAPINERNLSAGLRFNLRTAKALGLTVPLSLLTSTLHFSVLPTPLTNVGFPKGLPTDVRDFSVRLFVGSSISLMFAVGKQR